MTEKMVYAQNEANGVVALVPEHYLSHPNLGKNLKRVRNGKVRGRLSEIVKPSPEPQVNVEDEDIEEPVGETPKEKE